MSVAITLLRVIPTRRGRRYQYKAVFSNNYATGGDTVDLTAATNSNNMPRPLPDQIPAKYQVEFNDGAAGYDAEWVVGTTLANAKIKLFASGGAELAAGAYPAAVTGDDLYFTIEQSRRSTT